MDDKDLFSEAFAFRTAIMKAKRDGAFDYRDRMHNFPHGCCDDSCDLFADYLLSVHGIHTKQGNIQGRYMLVRKIFFINVWRVKKSLRTMM